MKPQKRMCSSKVDIAVDRLSEMPDQVLVHILSLMPTREALKTMLIRRFGDLWTMVHYISFDFNEHYSSPDSDDDYDYNEERRNMSRAFSRFARLVRNVLMFYRRSTIDSFHLNIGGFKGRHVDPLLIDDVKVWLKFATDKEVKDLFFSRDHRDKLALPRCIFTCQSIVTLTLCGSLLELDEHQPQLHMGTLRNLSLFGVQGNNEAFNQLISACSSLEKLVINGVEGLRNLNITAPSTSSLDLAMADMEESPFTLDVPFTLNDPFTLNCPHVKILDIAVRGWSPLFLISVIDVSSLQVVNVRHLPRRVSTQMLKEFLTHFQHAEVFTLSGQAFEQLCCLWLRTIHFDIPQNKWQTLALQPRWDNEACLQVITELVKSSQDLDELIIYSGESTASEGNHGVIGSKLSTCEMPSLKNVSIHGYGKYREGQLQLVEFILRNAVVLEKLVITREENPLTAVEELEQVLRFKRASANVIVEFA